MKKARTTIVVVATASVGVAGRIGSKQRSTAATAAAIVVVSVTATVIVVVVGALQGLRWLL